MKKVYLRPHGFPGQHMLVLPPPVRDAAARDPLLRGLLATDAGYFPAAAGHRVRRPQGTTTDLVIVCQQGRGWVEFDGERRAIRSGELVWLRAGSEHAYGARGVEPWTITWAHFQGEEVPAWRARFGIDRRAAGRIQSLPSDRLDEIGLARVYSALERGYAVRDLVEAAAALRLALSVAARLLATGVGQRTARERVAASVADLRRNWTQPRRLGELAAAASVSPGHYSALFRELTGFAPIDYLIRIRVQHACRLLDTTHASVAAVAAEAGYDDAYYFTRCFRRVMGCSPRAYRRIPKG